MSHVFISYSHQDGTVHAKRLREALTDPGYAWAWNGLGMCYSMIKDYGAAIDAYRNAVKHDDSDVWFWHNYAETATNIIERIGEVDALMPAAERERRRQYIEEARTANANALEIDPQHLPAQ